MVSNNWSLYVCYLISLFLCSSGDTMTITSNVTEVSIGDSYSVTCTSGYNPVVFYRNNTYIATPTRENYGATCMVNNKDVFNCTIIRHNNGTFNHQLIILSAKHSGTTRWQCKYTDGKVVSNNVNITITTKEGRYTTTDGKTLSTSVDGKPGPVEISIPLSITESTAAPQQPPPSNIPLIASLGATGFVVLLIIITVIVIICYRKRHKHKEPPGNSRERTGMIIDENLMYQSMDDYQLEDPVSNNHTNYDTVDDNLLKEKVTEKKQDSGFSDFDPSKVYGVVTKREKPTEDEPDPTSEYSQQHLNQEGDQVNSSDEH